MLQVMKKYNPSRREFLAEATLTTGAVLMGLSNAKFAERKPIEKLHLSCNQYSWLTFYQRENRDFIKSLETSLGDVAAAGFEGYEPLIERLSDFDRLIPLLEEYNLEMHSLYVNSTLHDEALAQQSIKEILAIADRAKTIGTKIIVTNPNPIRWGGSEDKDDSQLRIQAKALDKLGAELKAMALTLAYHNHDAELRRAAREFHHMLTGTSAENVTFCLDAHWVYRGSGDSSVALFDILKLYGRRITELHLRQSREGVWSETFGPGDIDYRALAKHLLDTGVRPHLVMEQACEKGTPNTMPAVEALRRSCGYAGEVFADFT